jgi:hypothetical protein
MPGIPCLFQTANAHALENEEIREIKTGRTGDLHTRVPSLPPASSSPSPVEAEKKAAVP